MKFYHTVTTNENLRSLCIKNNWFTEGSNKQYEKLFYANENGCPIEQIATIIWVCSDSDVWCRRDILDELKNARVNFWKLMFGVKDETQIYKVYDVFGTIHEASFIQLTDLLCDPDAYNFKYDFVTAICNLDDETVWERGEE
jgi:hypothetical protein